MAIDPRAATLIVATFIIGGLIAFLALLILRYRREKINNVSLKNRFVNVIDADAELKRVRALIDANKAEVVQLFDRFQSKESQYSNIVGAEAIVGALEAQAAQLSKDVNEIRSDYAAKRSLYDRLSAEVAIFDERLSFAEMGVYEPHFEFSDSEQYKSAITGVRADQKNLISSGLAVNCALSWQVDGSAAKGKTMIGRAIRLTLRAFNSECDAAISNTRWNNVNAMEKRIERAREQIDKHNASYQVIIQQEFVDLKREELYLTHEYREKLKSEREERAEAARASREEQKLQRDIEAAEEAEAKYQRLLSKARDEVAHSSGTELQSLSDQVKILEVNLAEAHEKVERAQALAERTRSGYVYIISNVGSFGANVIKIGLTRRLDPLDRIRELGDASVPFLFDVHAIIYSEDAPALERALHSKFEAFRVNTQNCRKEFFHTNIEEVELALKEVAPSAPFFRDVEAQEYRETIKRRQESLVSAVEKTLIDFPSAL